MSEKITARRQAAVLEFLFNYKRENAGRSPTYQEIMDGTGMSSKALVHYWLDKLEADGYISRPREVDAARTIRHIAIPGERWLAPGEV